MANIKEAHILLSGSITDCQARIAKREAQRGDTWPTYDRDFTAYMVDFSSVVNGVVLLRQLDRIQSPVVIDLMSSTDAVASLFMDLGKTDGLGIAVGRRDNREICQKERDKSLGIHQIAGDLFEGKTWVEIKKILAGRVANLIMEDGALAWDFAPVDKRFYGLMLNRLWNLLSASGGVLLAETPTAEELASAGVNMPMWRDMLLRDRIDFDYADLELNKGGLLRLRKTPDSPLQLPLLQ
ncbi:MAG: hypothetical protein A2171_01645 [Candidatus Levybacteria bacterium RBG_13_35_9]|nr:MAG: hypothetical protein A2171_01645 [Candidatus Levybacteria bacterium RBG_13_35_9]